MADLAIGFAVKGIGGDKKTLELTIMNARTDTVLNVIEFGGAEAVKEFIDTLNGLAAVVFPDPQKRESEE